MEGGIGGKRELADELADGEESDSEAKRSRANVRHEAAPVLAAVSSDLSPWDDFDASGLKSALQDVTLIAMLHG